MNIFFYLMPLTAIGWCMPIDAVADESSAFSPKVVLKMDFDDAKYWPAQKTRQSVEFCGGDWCQEVRIKQLQSAEAAWGAVFIMFYFFDANDEFKTRRESLATTLLDEHGKKCVGDHEERASCALSELQSKYGFEYRRVQYDVGYRCSSIFSATPPHFTGRGKCLPMNPSD